ncbi:MAG: hypothetical protein L0Y66_10850 [Myxococcaceae bacterium]|nr:hypothetical protein [Myxococcaceae bacterium]MCI0669220.1 hypothetical protein [Myxococcaceae bacterium]
MTRHLVLVPGFGGFDVLGSMRYYHGVTEALREAPLVLHYFPNLPSASVRTRARQLRVWLSELDRRHVIGHKDEVHLVGHSTGGLDLRQLLRDYARMLRPQKGIVGEEPVDTVGLEVLGRVRSAQFLSTPHRGTALAHHLNASFLRAGLSRLLVRGAYEWARAWRQVGVGLQGRLLRRLLPEGPTPDWVDALVDTALGFNAERDELKRAHASAAYAEALRWLDHMASDFSAIADLDPVPRQDRAPRSPAQLQEQERELPLKQGIRCASVVSVAPPPAEDARLTVYGLLHRLTAHNPPWQLGGPVTLRRMLMPGQKRALRLADNDGLVNSVSMVWPDASSSFVVEADHADVIGHFTSLGPAESGGPLARYRQYDLLDARTGFNQVTFDTLWRQVGAFALGEAYAAARSTEAA